MKFHLQKAFMNNFLRSAILFCVCEWGAMVCMCRPLVTDSSTADLKKLFKSAFYKLNFITRIQEISPLSTKIATPINTCPIYEHRTNIPANQWILHFTHHMFEIDIVPCTNNVSGLDPSTKQPYIFSSSTCG